MRTEAAAEGEAVEIAGRAEAEKTRALRNAEADGVRANLLAEAEGKEKLAQATAAEGEINLRQAIAQLLIQAEVDKARAIAESLGAIGKNVRIVQFKGADGAGPAGNPVVDVVKDIPELAALIEAKTEALFDQNVEQILERIVGLLSARPAPEETGTAIVPAPKVDAAPEVEEA